MQGLSEYVKGKDVVNLPTGYGKSLIYSLCPLVCDNLRNVKSKPKSGVCYYWYLCQPHSWTTKDFLLLNLDCQVWNLLQTCPKQISAGFKVVISIYLINQARGPIFSRYGPEQVWLIGDLLHDWRKQRLAKTQVRDHSGQCPVRYLKNIGPAIEHFDWLILVIGPLTAWVV